MYSAHLLIYENTTPLIWVNRFGWKKFFFPHQSRNHMKLRALSFQNDDDGYLWWWWRRWRRRRRRRMTINQSSLRKRRIFLHNSLVSSRAYVIFHHHQKTTHTSQRKKVSVGWLFVNSTRGVTTLWGHFCGDNQKKKIHSSSLINYYWSKFAERMKNEKWIIVYKTNNPRKKQKKKKKKKKSRSVCRRWSTTLQPRTELLLGRAGNTSLGRAVPLTHCRL